MKRSEKGFTLIELVMVIVILAVLAAVAVPIYVDLQSEANSAAEQGVVGGVRAGILTYWIDPARGNRSSYPATLDGAADGSTCDATTPCFGSILQQSITDGNWTKTDSTHYVGPTGTTYTYNTTTGAFS